MSERFSAPPPPRKRLSRPYLSLYLDFPLITPNLTVRQAPAQQRPHSRRQEARQHKERNDRKRQCISPLDSGI